MSSSEISKQIYMTDNLMSQVAAFIGVDEHTALIVLFSHVLTV